MALYLGEAVRIKASAISPDTQKPLDPEPTSASVSFWNPEADPAKNPEIRDSPDVGPLDMPYDETQEAFILFVSTEGAPWVDGKWFYRVTVQGEAYENFEFGNFKLRP